MKEIYKTHAILPLNYFTGSRISFPKDLVVNFRYWLDKTNLVYNPSGGLSAKSGVVKQR